MDKDEAWGWAAKLAAAYPTPQIADATIEWWAEAFEVRDREVVMAALKKITTEYTRFAPSYGQVCDVLREVAGSHPDVTPALPSETPGPPTPEELENIKATFDQFWDTHGGELERLKARRSRKNLTPEEKARLTQLLVEKALAPSPPPPRVNPKDLEARAMSWCPAVGGPIKWRRNHMTCPLCGDDLDPGCNIPTKDRKCVGTTGAAKGA